MAKIQSPSIPNEVKEQIQAIVAAYNAAHGMEYVADCKKKYCYISKLSQRVFPITKLTALLAAKQLAQPPKIETFLARLEWTGSVEKWELAIYLYSRETYTTDYWGFPGSEKFDGTVASLLECNLYAD